MIARLPVVAVCRHPLAGIRPSDIREVAVGTTLAELVPDAGGLPVVCTLVGVDGYVSRRDWGYALQPGDIAVFEIDPPQNSSKDWRGVLQVVALVVAFIPGGQIWAVAINIAAAVLLPIVAPVVADQKSVSPTYSTGLGGNQARLDQPIPKICGRHKVTPPFAAQPYLEYDDAGDQYYFALLAVGVGNHTIERALIDDTDINHFQDILVSTYLPPGTLPATVLRNVNTAPEVAGQNMVTGLYIGGFAACAPRKKANAIGIDVIADRGLGLADETTGEMGDTTIAWRVEIREINEFGSPLTEWTVLGSEVKTAATTKVQRWSTYYELPVPIRPEIRVVRTNVRNDNLRALNDAQWSGMRAYLDEDAPLNADTAHYEVVLRASEQLSGLSQRNISLIVQALAPTWHPDTGWGAEVATRNPAWALASLWRDPVWGEGLPDNRIDLQTLYDLSLVWDARQDRFDFVFDSSMDAWEAAQLIARSGRARVFRRYGVRTLARDELATLPVTAFTPRNTVPDSMAMFEALPTRDTPDGVIVEYFDNRQWAWTPVECPIPGVEEISNPVRKRLAGITGPIHAKREGMYEAASLLYRRRTVKCTTEMQGMLPAYMSPIRWQPEILGYGQSGDVVSWDSDTLVMGLSEPVTWGDSPNYLTLIKDDGSLTHTVPVLPGPNEDDILISGGDYYSEISAVVDNVITTPLDNAMRERPKYILGPLDSCDELVKISVIGDGGQAENDGGQLFDIEAVVDDARVHTADNAFLPGPGDEQDPIDFSEGEPGGGVFLIGVINSAEYGVGSENQPSMMVEIFVTFRMRNDGRLEISWKDWYGAGSGFLPGQWILQAPIEVDDAARFEVRFTTLSQVVNPFPDSPITFTGETEGAWLSMGTQREMTVTTGGGPGGRGIWRFRVELRSVDTPELIQATANISLSAVNQESGGGGD